MENYSIVLVILAIMIGLSAIADRVKLPYPVLLIVAGIGIGFIPSMPAISLNPEIVFLLFLPPLLYDAAFNIAVVAHYLIPGFTWPLSFVLGAILAATDSVAAMSITKGLNLPHKTITILEGESLLNDASALVAYRFAVAAVAGTVFKFGNASWQFLKLMGGGFVIGFIIGRILLLILPRLRKNPLVAISLMLLMPFITYLLAEDLHVSGVIAVVTLGLIIASLKTKEIPEHLKVQSRSIWEIIIFLLNGLIFILIGLQLPYVINSISNDEVMLYIGYAFIITITALLLRMARVFLQKVNLQNAFRKGKGKITEGALLDFKNSLIISWSGMRGIVSLAIAIGLPVTLADGHPFPERDAIIFISVMVVLFTLIGQGLTLPWLVRRLKIE